MKSLESVVRVGVIFVLTLAVLSCAIRGVFGLDSEDLNTSVGVTAVASSPAIAVLSEMHRCRR